MRETTRRTRYRGPRNGDKLQAAGAGIIPLTALVAGGMDHAPLHVIAITLAVGICVGGYLILRGGNYL